MLESIPVLSVNENSRMSKTPLIIAHLGERIDQLNGHAHVDGIELDLRMTRDRVVVVRHSRRVQHGDGRYHWIDRMTFPEVKAILGTTILTFEEALSYISKSKPKKLILDLDLKQKNMEKHIQKTMKKYPKFSLLACSPDIWTLKHFEEAVPTAMIGLTYQPMDRFDLWDSRTFRYLAILTRYSLKPFLFRLIRRKTAKKDIQVASINHKLVNPKVVQYLHQNNIQIYAWGTTSEKRLRELVKLGVDGIKIKYENNRRFTTP